MTTAALNPNSGNWLAGQEDSRYYWLQAFGLLVFVLLVVAIPQLTVPKPAVLPPPPPPPLTQLVLPEREIPPPPEIKKEEPKPEPKPEEKPKEKPKEKPVEASKDPVKPPPTVDDAREKAEKSGLLALKDDLADLRQAFEVDDTQVSVKNEDVPEQAANLDRKVIGQTGSQQFAAKDAAAVSNDIGRVALSEQGATNVKATQLKGLADKDTVERNRQAEAKNSAKSGKGTSGRSEAQIRQILEANKSSLYTLYNRALRQNPLLRGKVVFELLITPQGTVSAVKIVQSELGDAKLERQLQLRLQSVQFGPANVSLTRSQWTIEFLPG